MLWVENRSSNDPYLNLALEEYLVRNTVLDEPLLLLYINNNSVVIGKNQSLWKEANIRYTKEKQILIARRLTGGGTVFHDKGNINYSVISPFENNLLHNFKEITRPVLQALGKLGIHATLNEHNDLVYKGFKISGTAQFTNRKNILSHGTLLVSSDLEMLSKSLKTEFGKVKSKGIDSKRSKVDNLSTYADISVDNLFSMIRKSYHAEKVFEMNYKQWVEVDKLKNEKFKNPEWIYCKSPKTEITSKHSIQPFEIDLVIQDGKIIEFKIHKNGDLLESNDTEMVDIFSDDYHNEKHPIFSKMWMSIKNSIV